MQNPDGVPITTVPAVQETPSIAHDGQRYLVAWYGGTSAVRGSRTPAPCSTRPRIAISTAPNEQDRPVVSANGVFLVVWRDLRRQAVDRQRGPMMEHGWTATATCSTRPGSSSPPTAPTTREFGVAAGAGGTLAVTYQRLVGPPFGAHRAFLRTANPK